MYGRGKTETLLILPEIIKLLSNVEILMILQMPLKESSALRKARLPCIYSPSPPSRNINNTDGKLAQEEVGP